MGSNPHPKPHRCWCKRGWVNQESMVVWLWQACLAILLWAAYNIVETTGRRILPLSEVFLIEAIESFESLLQQAQSFVIYVIHCTPTCELFSWSILPQIFENHTSSNHLETLMDSGPSRIPIPIRRSDDSAANSSSIPKHSPLSSDSLIPHEGDPGRFGHSLFVNPVTNRQAVEATEEKPPLPPKASGPPSQFEFVAQHGQSGVPPNPFSRVSSPQKRVGRDSLTPQRAMGKQREEVRPEEVDQPLNQPQQRDSEVIDYLPIHSKFEIDWSSDVKEQLGIFEASNGKSWSLA